MAKLALSPSARGHSLAVVARAAQRKIVRMNANGQNEVNLGTNFVFLVEFERTTYSDYELKCSCQLRAVASSGQLAQPL